MRMAQLTEGRVGLVGSSDDHDPAAERITSTSVPYRRDSTSLWRISPGVPTAHDRGARYRSRSTKGRMGLTSWVTRMTLVLLAAEPVDDADHRSLRSQIEGEQRLVAQQERGAGHDGLGDADPLLLAPRQPPSARSA